MASKHKALIVGGGFGGVKTALELESDPRLHVTLLSDHGDFRYYPSLYRTATGASRNASSIPLSEIFAETDVEVLIDSAKSIDHENRKLKTKSGREIDYDVIVLALGMVTNYFGIPGLSKLSYGIKTIEEAEELKKHLHKHITKKKHPDLNYVIVGGGPTGVELAGVLGEYIELICRSHNISKRTIHVDLIEASPRLLPTMPKAVSRRIAKQLRKRGVRLYLNKAVSSQSADELIVNDKPIRSHTVIWTAGAANNPFYSEQNFQLSTNHKVRVDHFLQAKPGLYVIGDNADTPYSGLAQTALYDGLYVAGNIKRLADGEKPLPYKAKLPIYVLPAGPAWAAVVWGSLKFYGLFGWILRRAADLIAFHDYEPWFRATRHWLAESKPEELCELCDKS
jgi:NADH dehydrogenase